MVVAISTARKMKRIFSEDSIISSNVFVERERDLRIVIDAYDQGKVFIEELSCLMVVLVNGGPCQWRLAIQVNRS